MWNNSNTLFFQNSHSSYTTNLELFFLLCYSLYIFLKYYCVSVMQKVVKIKKKSLLTESQCTYVYSLEITNGTLLSFEKMVVFRWTKHSDFVCLFILLTQDTPSYSSWKRRNISMEPRGMRYDVNSASGQLPSLGKRNSSTKLSIVRFCESVVLFWF